MNERDYQFTPFIERFNEYIVKINESLSKEIECYSWSEFYLPLKYACQGGKRIRPLILNLAAETVLDKNIDSMNAKITENIFSVSSAVELLHTESVIHDDIIDSDNLRRGQPSFHVKYGYNASILTADFILGIILNISAKANNSLVTQELSKASIRMSEGEMLELRLVKNHKISQEQYISVIENKTASLFEASAKIGAILAGGNETQVNALANFGRLLGIAYQIHDDLIDYNNEERLFNILVKQNDEDNIFIEIMENTYQSYSDRARKELETIEVSHRSKTILRELTNLSSFS
ncbi:polyprenyl synthetase family protein [Candidatus Nitrosocosmicus sp. FF01]|uniref:polyprenyl synthetase family protein n=1 Tax=Candidatus Nitrosocosmicus sp. FF01 TaxID=3397670 RepID=UPI0039EC34E7